MNKTDTIVFKETAAGTKTVTRQYPIKKLSDEFSIVGFDYIGDTALIINTASSLVWYLEKLIRPLKSFDRVDYIITTATKGIPLAQEVSRILGIPYICVRKEEKVYMDTQVKFEGGSITSGKGDYFISEREFKKMSGANVVFVDDVYSTGATFNLIKSICRKAKCNLMAGLFILREFADDEKLEEAEQLAEYSDFYEFKHDDIMCCALNGISLIKN